MVGRIVAADIFDPKCALIIRNKDDLQIPLVLETIPTPKEFKDAIESMSPEQQRFCKAYRGMQLSSTLFGVVVLQIKPQLEKVLNIPPDSLTKEIRLTQDLLDLFIQYQIPSDLLAFDGDSALPTDAKLASVRTQVSFFQEMIQTAKDDEKKEQLLKTRYANPLVADNEIDEMLLSTSSLNDQCMELSMNLDKCEESRSLNRKGDFKEKKQTQTKSKKLGSKVVEKDFKKAASPRNLSIRRGDEDAAPKKIEAPKEPSPEPKSEPKKPEPEIFEQPDSKLVVTDNASQVDYTQIPTLLDSRYSELDEDNAVRPTIINIGEAWNKSSQIALILPNPRKSVLLADEQTVEKNKAFDLIDALSRSGGLPFDDASLHVVIAATHSFQQTLINTVIQENKNPIEKMERTSLIVATTIHEKPVAELVHAEELPRVQEFFPRLFSDQKEPKKSSKKSSKPKKLSLTSDKS